MNCGLQFVNVIIEINELKIDELEKFRIGATIEAFMNFSNSYSTSSHNHKL